MHEFCVRSGAGLEFQVGFPPFPPTSFTPSNPRFFHLIDKDDLLGVDYSKSGRYFVWSTNSETRIADLLKGEVVMTIKQKGELFEFSPKETYIAIWHKGHFSSQESKESNLTKDIRLEAGEQMQVHRTVFKSDEVERREKERLEMLKNNTPRENLLIYSIETGELQASFFQREKENWKPQWSSDDQYCLRFVTNTLHVYQNGNFDPANVKSIRVEKVQAAVLYPNHPVKVAVFIPEVKDTPASINYFNISNPDKAIASKTFFKAKEARLYWDHEGNTVIGHTWTPLGDHSLYLISPKMSGKIILDRIGTIDKLCWSSVGSYFFALYGGAQKVAVYDKNSNLICSFDQANYRKELISFSPDGRLISLGKSVGSKIAIEIREIKNKNVLTTFDTGKQLSFLEFSPESDLFVVGSHFPKVLSDNGFCVFNLSGKPTFIFKGSRLDQFIWRNGKGDNEKTETIPGLSPEDEKKVKNLKKKLKQIEDLKEKLDIGLELEDNQMQKVAMEQDLLKELEALTLKSSS